MSTSPGSIQALVFPCQASFTCSDVGIIGPPAPGRRRYVTRLSRRESLRQQGAFGYAIPVPHRASGHALLHSLGYSKSETLAGKPSSRARLEYSGFGSSATMCFSTNRFHWLFTPPSIPSPVVSKFQPCADDSW